MSAADRGDRATERVLFTAWVRTNGLPEFEIRDNLRPGVYQPAAERAEYFPVLYVDPVAVNRTALGYDPSSEPVRAVAMHQARLTGQASATDAVKLLRRAPDAADVQVVMVFAKQQRGAMARYIIQHRIMDAERIKAYDSNGYRFEPAESSAEEWVFLRDKRPPLVPQKLKGGRIR